MDLLNAFSFQMLPMQVGDIYSIKAEVITRPTKIGEKVVVFPIGISGSGKDYYQKSFWPQAVVVGADDIRQKWLGDVNNQSRNPAVFDIMHCKLKEEMFYGRESIYKGYEVIYSGGNS